MVRILSVASLGLAVVSAVAGHVIRHRFPPKGWETAILEPYDVYHARYLEFKCYEKHNTTYFNQCCHPLLKDQSNAVLQDRKCYSTADDGDDCDDGDSSIPPSTPTPYSPAVTTSSAEHDTPTSSPPVYSPEPSPVPVTSSSAQPKDDKPDSPETSSAPETTTTHTKAASPSPSPTNTGNDDGGDFNFGGFATFFYQKGNAGACGKVHSDDDLIAAMDERRYGNSGGASPLCGKKVEITNTDNGKTVVVIVADDCPTCTNSNSIDLSTGAFKQIASFDQGLVPIKWRFV